MGHRLSRIATHTGDDGTTGLADGTRLLKDHARIHVIGEVDELNSQLGVLRAHLLAETRIDSDAKSGIDSKLDALQHDLFDLGGELSMPGQSYLLEDRLIAIEEWLHEANADLPPLREFILPGGSLPMAQAHVCRTVARRAERALIQLIELEGRASPQAQALLRAAGPEQYLNRLSDFLFVLCRRLAQLSQIETPVWSKRTPTPLKS
ncbi:MAG: cob(I)yrinic acid a,c-diamide adenosyltransferase [Betaproteobacteria bacterium]|jgi:cob(I)alamin adenosyltransferase|nr:cob(I)yrinic acid a,c-diamide adenosyltransferase [Betaproteobacteria bacterium]